MLMVLQACPECAAQVSSLAATCVRCGCPVVGKPLAAEVPAKKGRSTGQIGTILGCLLILISTPIVFAVIFLTSKPQPASHEEQRVATRTTKTRPVPKPASFDPDLAARGSELHLHLLKIAEVHSSYGAGSLFGALSIEPKASIAVPLQAWKSLGDEDRLALMHYAASLVEPMRAQPLNYCQIPIEAQAANIVRVNARGMGPESWVIHGGQLEREGQSGPFDILTDGPVASGAEDELAPTR